MFAMDKTRILLDGHILKDVKLCTIELDFMNKKNIVAIHTENNFIEAEFKGSEVVEENAFKKDLETVTWTQFICNKKKEE